VCSLLLLLLLLLLTVELNVLPTMPLILQHDHQHCMWLIVPVLASSTPTIRVGCPSNVPTSKFRSSGSTSTRGGLLAVLPAGTPDADLAASTCTTTDTIGRAVQAALAWQHHCQDVFAHSNVQPDLAAQVQGDALE
jgi:hypothetical protein